MRRPSSSSPHSIFHDNSANLANAPKGRDGECSSFDTALTSRGGRFARGSREPPEGIDALCV